MTRIFRGNAIGTDFDIQQDGAGEFGSARASSVYTGSTLWSSEGAETPLPTRYTPASSRR